MEKNRRARRLYLLLVLGYSYVLFILELIFQSGAYYHFLAASFTFVPVISAAIVHRVAGQAHTGRLSLKVWRHPKALIASAFGPGILVSLGAALYFLVFPGQYSGVFALGGMIAGAEAIRISNPFVFALVCILLSAIFVPVHLLELGEEIGWRGFHLWNQAEAYGEPKAVLINGLEWGLAHLPLIYFGFNYSPDNWGAPWTNMLLMLLLCLVLGILLSYVTLKTGNCMFSAIMHGAVNIIGEWPVLCTASQESGLLGPNPTGLLSMGFLIAVSIIIFIRYSHSEG